MSDFLSKFSAQDMIGLVAVFGGLLIGITAIVASFWFKARKTEITAALKQDMLNRGMSADEIKTVLEAKTK